MKNNNEINNKIIFVTGGVASSLGKGVAAASIGLIIKELGYAVCIKKLDPYLNIDVGTMNPVQHGEVFVTDDGAESDLDLGYYERFLNQNASKNDSITAGKIYQTLLEKERAGEYLGQTVQVIPHVTNLIKEFATNSHAEVTICEIGGTVGDIEALPFLEAARQLKQERRDDVLFVHLTLVPFLQSSMEIKTKPTQHSVKELMSIGIIPDILICRTSVDISDCDRRKISLFCNVEFDCVIKGFDLESIYLVPASYLSQGLDKCIAKKLFPESKNNTSFTKIKQLEQKILQKKQIALLPPITIGIVGKYTNYSDSYKSLVESVNHAAIACEKNIQITWIDSRRFDTKTQLDISCDFDIKKCSAFIVAGGFGLEGLEGKINIIRHARENNIPTLGICLGMQMMVLEFARNIMQMPQAISEEMTSQSYMPETKDIIVCLMDRWITNEGLTHKRVAKVGGTMRLGSYAAKIIKGSLTEKLYGNSIINNEINERHRHRYEVLSIKIKNFADKSFIASSTSIDGELVEIVEYQKNRFHLGVQFHPEFKSRILEPHPLFIGLINNIYQ